MHIYRGSHREGTPYQNPQNTSEKKKTPERQVPKPQDLIENDLINETPKAVSEKFSTFNALLSIVPHALEFFGAKMVSGTLKIIENAVFSPEAIKNAHNESNAELEKMTGDKNLGKFLDMLSLPLSNAIATNLGNQEFVKHGISNEKVFFAQLTETMVAKMAVNIGKQLIKNGQPVTLLTISSSLARVVKTQFESTKKLTAEAKSLPEDDPGKGIKIKDAPLPAVDAILKHLFPEGAEEFPLREHFKSSGWSILRNHILPDVISHLTTFSTGLDILSNLQQENAIKDWNSIDQINEKHRAFSEISYEAKLIVKDKAPVVLADDKVADALSKMLLKKLKKTETNLEIEARPSLAAQLLSKALLKQTKQQETSDPQTNRKSQINPANDLKAWLAKQIQQAGNVDDPFIANLWQFLGGITESGLYFILTNLSKSKNPDQDWSLALINNMAQTIGYFEFSRKEELERVTQKLQKEGVSLQKIPESKEYAQCFVPLAITLEELIGFDKIKAFLPEEIKSTLKTAGNKNFCQLLAKNYNDYLSPLTQLLEAAQKPETIRQTELVRSLPEGELKAKQIESTANIATEQLSLYLADLPKVRDKKANQISNLILDSISTEDVKEMAFNLLSDKVRPLEEVISTIGDNTGTTATPLMDRDSTFAIWLNRWIGDQLLSLSEKDGNRQAFVLNFFKNFLGGVLEHIVLRKMKYSFPESLKQSVPEIVIKRVVDSFTDFDKKFGKEVHEHFIQLKNKEIQPNNDPLFIARFKPLCDRFVLELGMEKGSKSLNEKLAYNFITSVLPKYLAANYHESLVIEMSTQAAKLKIETLLQRKPTSTVATTTTTDPVVEQIGNLCEILAQQITPSLNEVAYEKMIERFGNPSKELFRPELISSKSSYVVPLVKSLLMQSLANYLERLQKEGVAVHKATPAVILKELAQTLKKYLYDDEDVIKKAAEIKDVVIDGKVINTKEKMLALRTAFTPLTDSLIKLLSPVSKDGPIDPENPIPLDLPFVSFLQDSWEEIQSEVIPDIIAEMFTNTTTWHSQLEESKATINTLTGANYLPEACRVLSHWVSDFIPATLCSDREDMSRGIYDGINKYLAESGNPQELSVMEFIQKNEIAIKKHLVEDIFSFYSPDTELVSATKPLTRRYMEAAFLKVCANLTTKIDVAQGRTGAEREAFMVKLGMNLLQVANDHFKALNETTVEDNKFEAHKVSHETYVKSFLKKGKLNQGIPQTPRGLEAHNKMKEALAIIDKERHLLVKPTDPAKKAACLARIRTARKELAIAKKIQSKERQGFLKPFSDVLMQLAGITGPENLPNDITNIDKDIASPLPPDSSVRLKAYDKFKDELLPMVMENIFAEIMDPKARVTMALSGLKTLNEALDSSSEIDEESLMVDDPEQRKLNGLCGGLVLQLVQLVPKSMIKAAFKLGKVQKLSAEMVGKAVRNYLATNMDLFRMLNEGVRGGLESLHPGDWETVDGVAKFVGKNAEGGLSEKINFDFPMDDIKLEARERIIMLHHEQKLKELRTNSVATAHRVISESFQSILFAPFLKLKLIWDFCVEKVFGKYAKGLREFFNFTAFKVIYRGLELCAKILSFPFSKIFWFFMDIYLGFKADHIIQSLMLDVHENLFYNFADVIIGVIGGKEYHGKLGTGLEIAKKWDEKEIKEVDDYIKAFRLTWNDIITNLKKKTGSSIEEPAS